MAKHSEVPATLHPRKPFSTNDRISNLQSVRRNWPAMHYALHITGPSTNARHFKSERSCSALDIDDQFPRVGSTHASAWWVFELTSERIQLPRSWFRAGPQSASDWAARCGKRFAMAFFISLTQHSFERLIIFDFFKQSKTGHGTIDKVKGRSCRTESRAAWLGEHVYRCSHQAAANKASRSQMISKHPTEA